jgi:hypothetical protein
MAYEGDNLTKDQSSLLAPQQMHRREGAHE